MWNFQKCLFIRNKSPCGSFIDKGELLKTYPWWINSFLLWSQKVTFPRFRFFVTFYGIRSLFYRKPKRSVWSIWTYSTGWILKFMTQKVSYRRKLKIWLFKKNENFGFGTQNGLSRLLPSPEYILNIYSSLFRNHPGSIPIYTNIIFNKIKPKIGEIYKIGIQMRDK